MNADLKKRWKAVCLRLDETGYTKEHIRKQIKISRTSIYCYHSARRGNPTYPQYVTESATEKLEKFFNITPDHDA